MTGERSQERLETGRLSEIGGYVAPRMAEIAMDQRPNGLPAAEWLRRVAVEMIALAAKMDGREPDMLHEQIRLATGPRAMERLRLAYGDRWSDEHDDLERQRLAEIRAELERAAG